MSEERNPVLMAEDELQRLANMLYELSEGIQDELIEVNPLTGPSLEQPPDPRKVKKDVSDELMAKRSAMVSRLQSDLGYAAKAEAAGTGASSSADPVPMPTWRKRRVEGTADATPPPPLIPAPPSPLVPAPRKPPPTPRIPPLPARQLPKPLIPPKPLEVPKPLTPPTPLVPKQPQGPPPPQVHAPPQGPPPRKESGKRRTTDLHCVSRECPEFAQAAHCSFCAVHCHDRSCQVHWAVPNRCQCPTVYCRQFHPDPAFTACRRCRQHCEYAGCFFHPQPAQNSQKSYAWSAL